MPVIINEIQIITTVGPPAPLATTTATETGISETEKQEIIAVCVEEVMRIMKEKQER